MEKYLIEQYDVFEDKNYLTKEEDIVNFFRDSGKELFDCGQGYYQDEIDLICKIGSKFYEVSIEAEITSAKQDVGDRLYWVDNIVDVQYKEIDKPIPKETNTVRYNLMLTERQQRLLENCMKENHIEIKYM